MDAASRLINSRVTTDEPLRYCRKLTWSKNGCIAYVSRNKRVVILRHLLCDPNDGQWKLSREFTVDEVSSAHGYHEIAHLSWSHTGTEIAIVDVVGRISIYNIFLAINRLSAVKRCSADPEDNLSAVVGLMWAQSDKGVRRSHATLFICHPNGA